MGAPWGGSMGELGEPTVTVIGPTVAAGNSGQVTIEARGISLLQVSSAHVGDVLRFDYDGVRPSPRPDSTYLMMPPLWSWETPTDVRVTLPFVIAADATPGTYDCVARAFVFDGFETIDQAVDRRVRINGEQLDATEYTFEITVE